MPVKVSLQLKDKETISFEEWCDANSIVKLSFNVFTKGDECLSLGKVSDMYETEQKPLINNKLNK